MITRPNKGDRWTREEMILVLNLYFKLSYGQMDHRNPKVRELAHLMGRSENSVAFRLNNFASCDPMLQARGISGLNAHIKQCQPYWNEFVNNQEALVFESERILADYQDVSIEDKFKEELKDIPQGLVGETRVREVKTRVNQSFFRQVVLSNYGGKCALTGIDIPDLLIASHIIPWADDVKERLNPSNGICLSALYDKAFDKGYIAFCNDGTVIFSSNIEDKADRDYYSKYFMTIRDHKIEGFRKYAPNPEFLEWHRNHIFKGL